MLELKEKTMHRKSYRIVNIKDGKRKWNILIKGYSESIINIIE